MYATTKNAKIEFAGILAEDRLIPSGRKRIIVNATNRLQFYVQIISIQPENFPREVRDVCMFGDDLDKWGFYDNDQLPEEKRKENLYTFLNNYILFFNVEQQKNRHSEEFYHAKNVVIHRKSDNYKDGTILEAIPVFSEKTTEREQETFEQQLASRKLIGDNKQISKDEDDTPSLVLWRENEDNTQFSLYGPFEKHETAFGGFKFYANDNQVRVISLPEEVLWDCYLKEDVLFVDTKMHFELQKMVELEGEILQVKTEETEAQKEVAATSVMTSKPANTSKAKDSADAPVDKEHEFMLAFEASCKQMGLYYDQKDLYNYHTAMKTGNLVILAGMSGTGKSKLVQCYANALKLNNDNLLFAPVSPSWQEDSDVIGYEDRVQRIYRPGDSGVTNILTHAEQFPDELHIICFDEMNLARVEHYFSKFLSILEFDENKRYLTLYNEEDPRHAPLNNHQYPPTLRIGSNVIFVGTVNIDESTYHFSDKVLDRANVITLNMIPYEDVLEMENERLNSLSNGQEPSSTTFTYDQYKTFKSKEKTISLRKEESKLLYNMHLALQESNSKLGVGWRIIRQISTFLNNLPTTSPLTREEAFDVQLVQRILTKVRGSEEQYQELIGRYDMETKEVKESVLLAILESMPETYTFEKSKKVIKDKAKELRLHGFTI